MNQIPKNLYNKLEIIGTEVRKEFQRKGFAIPVKDDTGSIRLGDYTIRKQGSYYVILDFEGEVLIDKINLPQSAAIIANNMALGRCVDEVTLRKDRAYGYALFEEELHTHLAKRSIKKDANKSDVYRAKGSVNHYKKEQYKREILKSFEKLKKFA